LASIFSVTVAQDEIQGALALHLRLHHREGKDHQYAGACLVFLIFIFFIFYLFFFFFYFFLIFYFFNITALL